ncbi:hypothetical protein A3765_14895 [Oleiphilus sp. HI0130]|jgi:uncharacterized protein (TIGR00255 family)|uniref:YicC/YloC family endoribonuclease n=1 Tax=Oleiphilus sp. HI0079 TaxID=1822254 RepID=UPI0007C3758C|nr:YicC/YloC family endoribonuclease [Oleiphilus sp. HI0079]KZZ13445.1 hypothetical protein A3750_17240 [Oleiphilus sp. HI0079]KZZ50518.1 hypothetical protein A3758_12505 [Oleiphilus sp. HI0118]KZZ71183.1 hypothetical protein A3765_14895 [Oleiphilus sp. HI0130]
MLKSMTAFARQELSTPSGTLTWEIRSVNHRYLEPNFRIPEQFREAESQLRELLRKKLARGKLDCNLKWQASDHVDDGISLNTETLLQLSSALDQISQSVPQSAAPNALDILQWPGVVDHKEEDRAEQIKQCVQAFASALDILIENRLREGQQLEPLFNDRLNKIDDIVKQVRALLPQILEQQRQNLNKRFEELSVDLDPQRLEQEMVVLAQKSDVDEELDRLDAHVQEVRKVLSKKEPVGRRLDFLMQELNREANTLSSKSIVTDTTKAAVELKVLIEQMREQVQNIE